MEEQNLNNNSQKTDVGNCSVLLTDLIDVIHYTIIKHLGKNAIALEEIQKLQWLIYNKKLENYSVEETEFWQFIMHQRNRC